jgi:hypothetical protein
MPAVKGAFYKRDGEQFVATELTRGPWDPGAQHAGPPAGLIGREIEMLDGAEDFHVGRVTFEILKPVPIGPVAVEVEIVRPGRRVQMVEATLLGEEGELIKARAWRLRRSEIEMSADLAQAPSPPGPEEGGKPEFFATGQDVGYHTAMEWRSVGAGSSSPGRRPSGCG